MPEYPGGSQYIEDNLGKDIEDAGNSKFAEKMFNDFEVGGGMQSEIEEEKVSTE